MNKTILASLLLGTALFISAPANALDSTGCGLGSMAWRGQSGIIPQVAAVTTNGIFGNQTFGITFGTSGCDPNGRVTGGTQKMILAFVENNMEQFALDAAAGHGETLSTLAGILNMDEKIVEEKTYKNFAVLFPNDNVDAVELTLKLYEIMKA
ncbi:MAG: DUF3015 family protein [Alphaproteobacteria bacterium]|nr:DUF3015 family protein [Alphaproteobacteria bacterium]